MSWKHGAWLEKSTIESQKKELKKHLTELNNAITYGVDGDGISIKSDVILKLHEDLSAKYEQLDYRTRLCEPHRNGGLI